MLCIVYKILDTWSYLFVLAKGSGSLIIQMLKGFLALKLGSMLGFKLVWLNQSEPGEELSLNLKGL